MLRKIIQMVRGDGSERGKKTPRPNKGRNLERNRNQKESSSTSHDSQFDKHELFLYFKAITVRQSEAVCSVSEDHDLNLSKQSLELPVHTLYK